MGSGGDKAINIALRAVKALQSPEPLTDTGVGAHAFDAMPDPDGKVVELFDSLTPRDAAAIYLSVSLGPVRDSSFVRDAQKALAVIKTLLVRHYYYYFKNLLIFFRRLPAASRAPFLTRTASFPPALSVVGVSNAVLALPAARPAVLLRCLPLFLGN